MSYLVDTNILVYFSNLDAEQHKAAKKFVEKCITNTDETWCFTWVNIFEYLRVTTHPSIFNPPMKAEDAEANVQAFLSLPQSRVLAEDEHFFEVYTDATHEIGDVTGNLVHDAHIAALMRQNGVRRIYTLDKWFRMFPFLECVNPL